MYVCPNGCGGYQLGVEDGEARTLSSMSFAAKSDVEFAMDTRWANSK